MILYVTRQETVEVTEIDPPSFTNGAQRVFFVKRGNGYPEVLTEEQLNNRYMPLFQNEVAKCDTRREEIK